MDDYTRYHQLTAEQRQNAQDLATRTVLTFWDAVAYLTRYGWDMEQAQAQLAIEVANGAHTIPPTVCPLGPRE